MLHCVAVVSVPGGWSLTVVAVAVAADVAARDEFCHTLTAPCHQAGLRRVEDLAQPSLDRSFNTLNVDCNGGVDFFEN